METYLKQALANEQFAYLLHNGSGKKPKCYSTWVFVIAYYSALHYLYAFLSAKKLPIPTTHLDYKGKDGAVTVASKRFFTTNHISSSCGPEFGQLFNWSTIARYNPRKHYLLGPDEEKEALKIMLNCKAIAFSETELFCSPSKKLTSISCVKLDSSLIPELEKILEEVK